MRIYIICATLAVAALLAESPRGEALAVELEAFCFLATASRRGLSGCASGVELLAKRSGFPAELRGGMGLNVVEYDEDDFGRREFFKSSFVEDEGLRCGRVLKGPGAAWGRAYVLEGR